MKKIFYKFLILFLILFAAGLLLPVLAAAFDPVGNVVFSVPFGACYQKTGETVLRTPDAAQTLAVYKAAGKPFLIVGPCLFHEGEDCEDFFFVNRTQVIRTGTDKGGDMWVRFFNRLYIMDDLSDCERLRTPLWDDLESPVRREKQNGKDVYLFHVRIHQNTVPAEFAIPAELFTPDMLNASNATRL